MSAGKEEMQLLRQEVQKISAGRQEMQKMSAGLQSGLQAVAQRADGITASHAPSS